MDVCLIYCSFVLITTAVISYIGREWPFRTLAGICMFLPALFAPWFARKDFIQQIIGFDQLSVAFQYSVVGGLLVILILAAITGLVTSTGWGVLDEHQAIAEAPDTIHSILSGFLRVAGEEIGWRCFLLPCLLDHYSTFWALFISGVVWSLYHVPVMVVLTRRLKPRNAGRTVMVQALSVFIVAYIQAWVAIKSGFSLWAPAVMHFTWNRLNPVVFGSIYTQEGGKVKGEQWLINGEGLAGCIVMAPIAIILMCNIGL